MRHVRRSVVGLGAALMLLLLAAATAVAAPVLDVNPIANTSAQPGTAHDYFVWISNVGDTPTSSDITLTVALPPGIIASAASDSLAVGWDCSATTFPASTITCTDPNPLDPRTSSSHNSMVRIRTDVDAGVATGSVLTPTIDVSGGGADPVSTLIPTRITAAPLGFGINAFDGQVFANAAGDPLTQSGGYPYSISTAIFFNTSTNAIEHKGPIWPAEPVKDIVVDLPPGFIGNPTATDVKCTLEQLANSQESIAKPNCPSGSQVGESKVFVAGGTVGQLLGDPIPVFSMVPPSTAPARFGMNVSGTIVTLDASLRTGTDNGLTVNVRNISQALAIAGTQLTFWGVPSDPSHDAVRACPGETGPGEGGPTCATPDLPRRPFLRNPTTCIDPSVGLRTTARIDSWQNPGAIQSASFIAHEAPAFPNLPDQWGPQVGLTGCADLPFEPSLTAKPVDAKAGAPSGFSFDLTLPQTQELDTPATADLKSAVVTLPVGLRVSPSSASGLGACAPAQIGINDASVPSCPQSSRIGTVTIDTPLLDDPLEGFVYLAKPHDNPFDSLISLYVVAEAPGLVVKLPGKVDADPITGQLTATFDDNPQLPFSNLHLEFKGGPRAALVNPPVCGTYSTHAVMTSWSGATVASDSSFAVSKDGNGTPCAAPQFSPDFEAGVNSVAAGKSTSFDLRLSRDDDDEELKELSVAMPLGLLAKVKGVPLCGEAQAKAGTCGEGSRIGSVLTGAGAGTNPFYLPGRVYLTDAYKGGPFGLSIVVPAVAGPFDLGTVVVRASIRLDRTTAQLRVISDPLPEVLQGIRLQLRDVRVAIDRPSFMVNPTSCTQKAVTGSITSTAGKTANVSSRLQVGGCSKLPLKPKMTLTVGAKGRTTRGTSTPLTAKLTQKPGQSNLKSVGVTLPLPLNALLDVVEEACTPAEFAAGNCAKARTGSAVAVTPLLDKPLRGSAYFVKRPTGQKGLPNLVVALRGQVDFDLTGKIVIPKSNRLSTRFETVPDVPITSFTLRLAAGKDGALGVAENLCTKKSKRSKAQIVFTGQNGRVIRSSQRLNIRGCASKKGK